MKYALLIPLLAASTQTPSACTQQAATPQASIAPAIPGTIDLSTYSPSDLDAYQQYCNGMVKYCLENGDHTTAAQWTALRDRVIQVRHSKVSPSPTPKRTPERRRYRGTPRQRHETTEESTPVSTPTPVRTRPLYWPSERLDEP